MAQLVTVAVGPLATADADGVGLVQTAVASAGQYLVLNGALATGTFSASSVCAAQTLAGAENLVINGTLATTSQVIGAVGESGAAVAATVRFPTPQRLYVTAAGNSSSRTITITGTLQDPTSFGPGRVVAETVTAPNTNVIATTNLFSTVLSVAISGASTGNISVGHSGTATMDKARRVTFDSNSDDSDITFTITGTDINGDPNGETLTGGSTAVVTTVQSYLTVTSIRTSAAASGTVTIGSSAIADSQWVYFDRLAAEAPIAIQVEGSGTVNWTVRQTLNDVTIPQSGSNHPTVVNVWPPASVVWVNHPDSGLVASAVTTGVQGNYAYAPAMAKVVLNSGTGSIRATFIQSSLY